MRAKPNNIHKILVVTLSNLGDVILTLPVFQSLAQSFPEAKLHVLVGAGGWPVVEKDVRFEKVFLYDKKISWHQKLALLGQIRRGRYDLIIDLRKSMFGFLGGARFRNGYFHCSKKSKHRALRHLEALRGITHALPLDESFLKVSPKASTKIQIALGESAQRLILACVGSKSDIKKWPALSYARLLDRLAIEHNCRIILAGDNTDADAILKVKTLMTQKAADFSGQTCFDEFCALVSKASLVVTNDSAPLHIADALKIPTLALFGPTDPRKYGPRFGQSLVARRALFCAPCEQAQCRYHHECLRDLGVDEVYRKALEILNDQVRPRTLKVLVIRLDRMGDVLLSMPAVAAIRRQFPNAFISMMVRSYTKELVEGHELLDEVIVYEYEKLGVHRFGLGYFRFLKEIIQRRFDVAFIFHPSTRSHLIPFLAGIPYRIGFKSTHPYLLTHPVEDKRREGTRHESEYTLDLIRAFGIEPQSDSVVSFPFFMEQTHRVETLLKERGWNEEGLLAIHWDASCPSKRWPRENFLELAKQLMTEFPHRIVWVGGPQAEEEVQSIHRQLGEKAINLAGVLNLKESAALLKKCSLLISNDSGPVHLAAAARTPTLTLYGRNQAGLSLERWKAFGQGHRAIQKDVGCVVCLAHRCTISFECLKAIQVDEVFACAKQMLKVFILAMFILMPGVLWAEPVTNFSKNVLKESTIEAPLEAHAMGEHLVFDVFWMGIPVGIATLEVKEKVNLEGKEAIHLVAIAETNDFLSKLYPVHDEVHSFIDAKTLCSLEFSKQLKEGRYRAHEKIRFDAGQRKGFYESFLNQNKKEVALDQECVQDLLSSFFWFRLQPITVGKSIHVTVSSEEKNWDVELAVLRQEKKELRKGVFDTILVEPKTHLKGMLVQRGRALVSFTSDARRLPLVIALKTPFGPVVGVLRVSD